MATIKIGTRIRYERYKGNSHLEHAKGVRTDAGGWDEGTVYEVPDSGSGRFWVRFDSPDWNKTYPWNGRENDHITILIKPTKDLIKDYLLTGEKQENILAEL